MLVCLITATEANRPPLSKRRAQADFDPHQRQPKALELLTTHMVKRSQLVTA